ncbi:hypothetical protein AMTRI_Chr11g152680 [Amborella trichopoda]
MKFRSIFNPRETFLTCKQPKTHSFRAGPDIYRSINSVHIASDAKTQAVLGPKLHDPTAHDASFSEPNSWFFTDDKNSSHSSGFSTDISFLSLESNALEDAVVDGLVRGLCSKRFFFEPEDTSSILGEAKDRENEERESKENGGDDFIKESFMLAMESDDPYMDFRVSMEEMVQAHGIKEWSCLEELLQCYLRVNGKKAHKYIVGAFVDLLIGLLSEGSP